MPKMIHMLVHELSGLALAKDKSCLCWSVLLVKSRCYAALTRPEYAETAVCSCTIDWEISVVKNIIFQFIFFSSLWQTKNIALLVDIQCCKKVNFHHHRLPAKIY